MDTTHVNNPLKVEIEIELLKFKDSIRHIEKSLRRGHISEEDAHRLRNGLASVYATQITRLVDERRSDGDG
jgi:hypothetical protein